MPRKLTYSLLALAFVAAGLYLIAFEGGTDNRGRWDISRSDIPDPYYLDLRKADVHNPVDLIRYSSSIKDYAANLDVFEKAAFYEWYFRSHGFDVSFAYSENFAEKGKNHVWLLVKNQKGEVIEVDPSYGEVGMRTMLPLNPEYTEYDLAFEDIYEASESLGTKKWAWWKDETARQAMDENVLLAQKEEAMRVASE